MPNTPIHTLPYPTQVAAGPGPDVPSDIKVLADAIDPKLTPYSTGAGNPADIPLAAGKAGRRFRNSITGSIWLDIGAAWVQENQGLVGGDTILVSGGAISVKRVGGIDSGLGVTADGLFVIVDDVSIEKPAGGALRVKDGGISGAKIANALKPSGGAAAGTEALRALGVAAGTAAAGNDNRFPAGVDIVAADLADGAVTDPKLAALPAWITVGAGGGAPDFGFEPIESIFWTSVAGRTVQFFRARGFTHIRGLADGQGSSQPMPAIFTLPAGYPPSQRMDFPNTEGAPVIITAGGAVSCITDVVNLDGISFRHA